MNFNSYKNYTMSEEREKDMWKEAIFVFDTSALFAFYFFSKNTRNEIFNTVFSSLKGRLWIPGHVEFEFLKNRENTLKKPIDEKYYKLEKDELKKIKDTILSLNNLIKDFNQKVSKQDNHPFIDDKIITKLNIFSGEINEKYNQISNDIMEEFKKRIEEIELLSKHDIILEEFQNYFNVGEEYDFDTIMDIVKEGKIRYENSIPPGYGDDKKKRGIQKYGDLIIWKQIIDYAKNIRTPIFFITEDVTKDDSCLICRRSNEIRIEKPYDDMIKEIKDKANADFWMYTFSQFLYKSKIYVNSLLTEKTIDEVKTFTNKNTKILFHGMYVMLSDQGYANVIKFFEDGKVITVTVDMSSKYDKMPKGIKELLFRITKWFDYNYEDCGYYQVSNNDISFYSESSSGKIDYNGVIDENRLVLNVFSHINGNKSERVYNFYSLDNQNE